MSNGQPMQGYDYNRRVMRVLLYIQQHLDEALSLETLAEVANVSPFYFHRLFKGMVGEPVLEHVRRLRLERAAYQLKSTEKPISHIAFDAGYETHEAFSRAFRAAFQQTPSAYRKEHRFVPKAYAPSDIHYSENGWIEVFTPQKEGRIMDVKIIERTETKIASVRHIGPYENCHAAWETLCGWAGPAGLLAKGPQFFGLSYDDPEVTPAENLRYDACITLGDADVEPGPGVDIQTIPAGIYASYLHRGSLEGLNDTYIALMRDWLPTSGYETKDAPSLEIYHTKPDETPPDQMVVEIQIPLEKSK